MGGSKRTLEKMWEEDEQKRKELLEVPSIVAESHELIGELKAQLGNSRETIASLKKQIVESNSIKVKLQDYFVGGLVGAILGAILAKVL
ncbi:hypothetical protein KFV02_07170 [Desulfohalobiaceae bacterium Ax17]|uniref:hypothetical protein n=1 Tax=Desulfovulcanus ferrireducens TaxID=2831190 RepID=UPI00207BC928|nr:hypothetical protein [Desulfovulcanus ferrireducens]MBT8763712.1 hypothetical protein [Desulfovulcanus ferrireducens]